MPFRHVYGAPATELAALARSTGRGQLATQAQTQDAAIQQADDRLAEQQRQFDIQTAMRLQAESDANRLRQQQLGQQGAAQQAALAANLYNQEQARAASIYGNELDYQQAADTRDFQYGMNSIDAMEKQAKDALFAMNKMNLSPEGKRIRSQVTSDANAIFAGRGTSIRDGEAYAGVLGKLLQNIDRSGIDDHEEVDPTPEEWFGEGTYTAPDGAIYGRDRSGAVRKLQDPPPRPLTPQEIQANTHSMPSGETMFINPTDGKPYFSSPVKPETGGEQQYDFYKDEAAIRELAKIRAKDDEGTSLAVTEDDLAWAREQYKKNRGGAASGDSKTTESAGLESYHAAQRAPDGIPIAPDPATAATWPKGTVFYTPDGRKKVVE